MAILNNNPLVGASGNQGGYNINNSLRFRASASARLSRTPASAGNRKTWTWSAWVKRGALGSNQSLFSARPQSGAGFTFLRFVSDTNPDTITFADNNGASLVTSALHRDVAAWYHIVLSVDTTQATAANRVRIYVNGNQVTAFSTATYPSQNLDMSINNNINHWLANNSDGAGSLINFFDGYMAEVNFIDGQALTQSSFGETDTTTGVWKPKAYTGTYGTNGFYLKFSDIATTSGSNTGLGRDFSGNGNFWNTNNISVTAGATYDAMTDVPTLTSATAGNYCTLNSAIRILSGSITEGNLRGAGSDFECWGTMAFPSTGKFYFEYTQNGSTGAGAGPGTGIQGINPPDVDFGVHYHRDGRKWVNGTYSSYGATFTTNDIIGVAYDADSNSITFYKNNVSQGAISTTSGYTYLPYQFDNSGNGGFLNFGQRPFAYTPPTGFVRLNTFNLPDSTIKKGNSYMDAVLYTGNGASRTISGYNFLPDFSWIKSRSAIGGNRAFDTVRGATKALITNLTNAEATESDSLTAFTSTGYSLGADTVGGGVNQNGVTYVGWGWSAGNNTTSSNTSGSITSTVSVNTTAGFSIVTYTGNGSSPVTIGHGLGVAPKFIIIKDRSVVSSWVVQHTSLGWTQGFLGITTAAASTSTLFSNNTAPTSSVFTVGGYSNNNAENYVAYCWAEIAGFSRFGSYTGNGSTDGTFIYTGFRPKFVMFKRTDAVSSWAMFDTSRNTYNVTNLLLLANASAAEFSGVAGVTNIDFLSNGIKLRGTDSDFNGSGASYIYMAFAENPFKNALAR